MLVKIKAGRIGTEARKTIHSVLQGRGTKVPPGVATRLLCHPACTCDDMHQAEASAMIDVKDGRFLPPHPLAGTAMRL
jgi:hypothetical protein